MPLDDVLWRIKRRVDPSAPLTLIAAAHGRKFEVKRLPIGIENEKYEPTFCS
jgi:hypothetical protein